MGVGWGWGGVGGGGQRYIIHLSLHCHHQNDSAPPLDYRTRSGTLPPTGYHLHQKLALVTVSVSGSLAEWTRLRAHGSIR